MSDSQVVQKERNALITLKEEVDYLEYGGETFQVVDKEDRLKE